MARKVVTFQTKGLLRAVSVQLFSPIQFEQNDPFFGVDIAKLHNNLCLKETHVQQLQEVQVFQR